MALNFQSSVTSPLPLWPLSFASDIALFLSADVAAPLCFFVFLFCLQLACFKIIVTLTSLIYFLSLAEQRKSLFSPQLGFSAQFIFSLFSLILKEGSWIEMLTFTIGAAWPAKCLQHFLIFALNFQYLQFYCCAVRSGWARESIKPVRFCSRLTTIFFFEQYHGMLTRFFTANNHLKYFSPLPYIVTFILACEKLHWLCHTFCIQLLRAPSSTLLFFSILKQMSRFSLDFLNVLSFLYSNPIWSCSWDLTLNYCLGKQYLAPMSTGNNDSHIVWFHVQI